MSGKLQRIPISLSLPISVALPPATISLMFLRMSFVVRLGTTPATV